jgi:hypothetical protein
MKFCEFGINKVPAVGLLLYFGGGRDVENIFSLFITLRMFREAKNQHHVPPAYPWRIKGGKQISQNLFCLFNRISTF